MLQQLQKAWLDLPIRFKGGVVISIPVLMLLVLLATVAVSEGQRRQAGEGVLRGEEIRFRGQRLLASLLQAQGAVEAYAYARDERLLQPYATAAVSVRDELRALRGAAAPELTATVQRLESLAEERLDQLEQNLRVVGSSVPEARRRAALTRAMAAGHARTAEFEREVQTLDSQAEAIGDRSLERLTSVRRASAAAFWAAVVLGIAGGLFALLLFTRGFVDRIGRLKENAARIARGDTAGAEPLGEDEIGRLGGQFEEMIFGLLSRELQLRDGAAALQETSALQRAILDSADYTIISTDPSGVIRTFNRAAEHLLGYRADELVGRATPEVFHDRSEVESRAAALTSELGLEVRPGFEAFVAKARRGETDENEWTYVGKDGRRTPVLLSVTALRSAGGEVTGFLGIGSDITQRKQYERELVEARETALEASKAKSEFLATMSHEIRTPMNAIIGVADLLSETPLSDDQEQYVSLFQKAGNTLLQLINDILDLSKVEAGQLELEESELNLRDLAEQTAEFFSVRSHEKGLELACDVRSEVPERVIGDPHRVRQILVNLLGNAVKFTTQGEIVLRVTRDPDDPDPGALVFSVTDTGPGIPPEKLEKVFEAFTQVDSSTTRKYGGTGLGLTISSRLAGLMGGRITVQSEEGKGSRFEFRARFPVVAAPAEAPAPTPVDLVGIPVLVVDDNSTNRLILTDMLAGWGAAVTEAPGGEPALEAIRAAWDQGRPYRLVLLDGRMPDLDGFQVAGMMRKEGWWADTTVMMLTSDNRAGDILRSREIGLAGYLVKPIKRADLLSAIQAALARHAAPGERRASAKPAPAIPMGAGKRILLVEDSPDNRTLVLAYLRKTSYEVEVAEDGRQAIDRFTGEPFDLVLMDVQMPVMDGYAATEEIRRWEQEHGRAHTPILALTANALREDTARSLDAGCDGHLTKPIKKSVLLEALEQHLAPHRGGNSTDGKA